MKLQLNSSKRLRLDIFVFISIDLNQNYLLGHLCVLQKNQDKLQESSVVLVKHNFKCR